MKIKYNIPMINNMKEKMVKIKNKLNKKDNSIKEKIPIKYYTLLFLMLMLGVVTLAHNIKEYKKSNKENYSEYSLEESKEQDERNNIIASNEKVYLTAESSIYTNEENTEVNNEKALEVISKNSEKTKIVPVQGEIIKEYAMEKLVYSETLGMWKTHPGIDIASEVGTNVISVSNGEVIEVVYDDFYGNTVVIEDESYTYKYSNLDEETLPKKGDVIKQGETIGVVGVSSKGEIKDKSHLHFEILKENIQINPLDLINFQE